MLNTHFANVIEVGDILCARKFAAHFALFSRFDIFIGGEVVHYEGDFFFIENVAAEFIIFADSHGGSDVVAEHEAEVSENKLTCGNAFEPCGAREYFLRHGHSHCDCSPWFLK
jgi:hypothetical protein